MQFGVKVSQRWIDQVGERSYMCAACMRVYIMDGEAHQNQGSPGPWLLAIFVLVLCHAPSTTVGPPQLSQRALRCCHCPHAM